MKNVGEQFKLKLGVADVSNLAIISVWISYNPALVRPVDNDPNTAGTQVITENLGLISNATILANVKKVNGVEEPGTLIVGYGAVPPNPVSGNGDAFQVTFEAIAAGEAVFSFIATDSALLDPNQNTIPADYNPVALTINDVVPPQNATVTLTIV